MCEKLYSNQNIETKLYITSFICQDNLIFITPSIEIKWGSSSNKLRDKLRDDQIDEIDKLRNEERDKLRDDQIDNLRYDQANNLKFIIPGIEIKWDKYPDKLRDDQRDKLRDDQRDNRSCSVM